MTGLEQDYIIEAHGSFATASCVECQRKADTEFVKKHALKGQVPRCEHCDQLIKPDITFFGENLPKRFFEHLRVNILLCCIERDGLFFVQIYYTGL